MARKSTGTIQKTKAGAWQAIITLADGSRKRLPPFPKGTSEAMAREKAQALAERAREMGVKKPTAPAAPVKPADSCERWFETWLIDRQARGYSATGDNAAHYRLHIAPSIGDKHIRTWARDDLRKLSHDLDTKVQAREISWKTAANVWATATKMCSDAANAKRDDIRCRDDNPATDVRGPDRGDGRAKQWLYPSEFLRFVTCQEVPLRWRRIVAVGIYLYMRDAELRVLDCEDVDLEHLKVHVTKALSKKPPVRIKATKGRRRRHVPIEAPLVPLLGALRAEAGERGRLLPEFPSERDMARGLRRWLKRAGITRRELHEETPTSVPITFHDLRSTGCTWMAIRGDDPLKIQQRAGHTDFKTTQGYIRVAELLRDGFGSVFPALPPELFERRSDDAGSDAIDHLNRSLCANYAKTGGADGTRTRGLRRDRPAL